MGEPGCPLLAANEECIWTIMHRCEAPDLLRLALTCKRLHASALALAEAKLLRRWPRWRRRMAGGTSVLVQLVVSELSCMLAVGGTWKPEDYWGAEASSADSATDSVEAAFVLLPTPGLLPEGERRFGMWGGAGAITTGSGPSEAEPDGAAGDTAAPICAELSIDWLGGVRPLPFAWRRGCTVSVRNLVFVAGGCIRNAQTRLCYAYAPELDKWMQAPSLERKRNVAAAALHLGGAWVVGGYDGKLHLASTEHLTPPADHAHVADADSDGQGDGDGLDGPLAEAEGDRSAHGRSRPPDEEGEEGEIADELRSWRWRQAPSLLTARSSLGVASVRGTLYAVGGYGPAHDAPTATATALRSAEMLRRGAGAWEALPSLSEGRSDLALVAYAGHLYAIGGSTTVGRPTPLVERLRVPARDTPPADSDDDGFAWERLPQLLVPRSGAGAAVVAGRLVVVGGKGPSNVRLSSVEVLCQGAGR
ncbi:hypothetical protein T492DRAFT_242263 [Pavlovales sp. CCMP2436]|nr:hypothetical protein T492DRAFT_242263 [Pavlovales sp. CCMP2436]